MGDENGGHDLTAGVTFGPLKRAIREHSYPVSVAELVELYGGFELETDSGTERLETALERCEQTSFHDPRAVRDAILDGLGEDVPDREAIADESGEADEEDEGSGDDWSPLSA